MMFTREASPLIVDLPENAENKGFFHVENEQHLSEVRSRKVPKRVNPIKTN